MGRFGGVLRFRSVEKGVALTGLERELLECAGTAGETTTTLDEEMLEVSPGRAAVEAALLGLVDRGLMTTEVGIFGGIQRNRDDGRMVRRVYEDDWWAPTPAGRAAVGLPHR